MRPYTDKQQKYIEARAAGLNKVDAAKHAGYGPNGIVTASTLEKRADVKAAIKAWKKKLGVTAPAEDEGGEKKSPMKDKYASSLALMQDCYNNPKLPPVMRFEAAKQALPYEHGRIGEKGKKATKDDDAAVVAKKPKFAANKPPALKLVSNK